MDATKVTVKSTIDGIQTATSPKESTKTQQTNGTHANPQRTHPDTQIKQPFEGSNKRKLKQNTIDGMLDYFEKEEKKALKKKRSKKVTRTKEPFFIDPIYGPVTGRPDRTPPTSLGVFDGEISPEPTPSNTRSPTSTKNHNDSNGKSH